MSETKLCPLFQMPCIKSECEWWLTWMSRSGCNSNSACAFVRLATVVNERIVWRVR